MKLALLGVALAAGLEAIHARSLSYRMKAYEPKACFYAIVAPDVRLSDALLQFYFSATNPKGPEARVNVEVLGVKGERLYTGTDKTHDEVNIKPPEHGEYGICFTHQGAPKEVTLDLDFTLPASPSAGSAPTSGEAVKLENTVTKLNTELSSLVHTMRYMKNRERRHSQTLESIQNWIFYISSFEVVLIVGMSLLQVTVLRMFFSGSRKQRV